MRGRFARIPAAPRKPKVFDNDNLPREDKLSIVGQPAAPAAGSDTDAKATQAENSTPSDAKPGADNKTASPEKAPLTSTPKAPDDDKTKENAVKQWADKLAAQKDQIDLLTRELDVLQREYQIRAAAMYADAGNRMRNSGDWDKQDAQYKQQIADKQKAIEDAKQKLEDTQEDARKAGVPASVREP